MVTGMALTAFAAGAAWQDLRKDKIFNRYVLPGLIAGLFLQTVTGGPRALFAQVLCVMAAFIVTFPLYLVSALGAGDVKFLTAAAAFVPLHEWFLLSVLALVIAAVYGIGKLIVRRSVHGRIHFAVPVLVSAMVLQGVAFV